MKVGILISVLIVVVIAGLLVVMNQPGTPDAPTSATSPERLAKATLPADLPPVFTPANPGADATDEYLEALTLFRQQERALTSGSPPRESVERLTALLVEAARSGRVDQGFLDRFMPLEPGAHPQFGPALEWLQALVLDEARRRHEAGEAQAAADAAIGVWALGQRAFEQNVRLHNRLQGLALMQAAGAEMYDWPDAASMVNRDALAAWAEAINDVDLAWAPKLAVVSSVDPHIGDLINIARHDQDPTFRLAATLHMGIAQHAPGSQANLEAIQQALADLAASDDPRLAEAAQAAADLTVQEMRRIH